MPRQLLLLLQKLLITNGYQPEEEGVKNCESLSARFPSILRLWRERLSLNSQPQKISTRRGAEQEDQTISKQDNNIAKNRINQKHATLGRRRRLLRRGGIRRTSGTTAREQGFTTANNFLIDRHRPTDAHVPNRLQGH